MTRRASLEKAGLHPRSRHGARYDFPALIGAFPPLAPFVRPHEYGGDSIDFSDPAAVKALNRALLAHFYGVAHWDIPDGYLCPPIPGRADYLHQLADLLAADCGQVIPRGSEVAVLDIGVGANCVYPIIGAHEYGWRFVGSEIDPAALQNARKIIAENPSLPPLVECRRQPSAGAILRGIIKPGESFAATVCNPPFHTSAAAAASGTERKLRNLGNGEKKSTKVLNFGGQPTELWCQGGELAFIRRLVGESREFAGQCGWFTTLVSKSGHVPLILELLRRTRVGEFRTLPMRHGQKQSRIVAWSFRTAAERAAGFSNVQRGVPSP